MRIAAFAVGLSAAWVVTAQALELDPLFRDHAVVQRDAVLRIWGTGAKPGEKLAVAFAGTNAWTQANAEGSFCFAVPPRTAGGPHELTVTDSAGATVSSKDILVGEVWLASGQSNMAFSMGGAQPGFGDRGDELLRAFGVPGGTLGSAERQTANGGWAAATPDKVNGFTAVGTFFGRALRRELGVPVGIVWAADGGTRIEAWSSRPSLADSPAGRRELKRFDDACANPKVWAAHADRKPPVHPLDEGPTEAALRWAADPQADADWPEVAVPSSFVDLGHMFNGAVWYVRTVRLPDSMRGHDLELRIPGVDKQDKTFVNGVKVGETGKGDEWEYYDKPRCYKVSAETAKDGVARVAIRVWSQIYAGRIGSTDGDFALVDTTTNEKLHLASIDWRWRIERDCGETGAGDGLYLSGEFNSPHSLFDAKIAPLAPMAMRGAIWYQGESNEGNASEYRELLGAMVRGWRARWGIGDFPFIAVQLAGLGWPTDFLMTDSWSVIRDGMLSLSFELPNFGIVTAADIGDVGDIHPKNKLAVGERLARWALNHTYGRTDVVPTGPRVTTVAARDRGVVLSFVDVGTGLCTRGGGNPRGFFLAGADGRFKPAEARIEGASGVYVSSDAVPSPVEVRYGWSRNPSSASLVNSADLPASPFRRAVVR